MPSIVVDQIDAQEATIASFRDPAREETLVAAAKKGNGQAFEILVKRHERKILTVARRYTRAQEDAEDVVQQTFQNAFIHLRSFAWKSSFSTWLTRVAINEALMLLRRRRALHEMSVDELTDREGNPRHLEIPDSSSDPEASYARRERAFAFGHRWSGQCRTVGGKRKTLRSFQWKSIARACEGKVC